MGKSIICTEKSSVARDYAAVLGVTEKFDGYMENDQWIITWCRGHLIEMEYPEKYDPELAKWKMETLPFLPEQYRYAVMADTKQQFDTIKKLYHRPDVSTYYFAGDAAREGLYIQMLVRQMAGVNENADERVIWIDSQTEAEIKRGIREAKPLSSYENMKESGYMRAIEDYASGINFSRILSIKYGNLINAAAEVSDYTAIAVGRVMTCVMGMVVIREREIENFKVTPFYKIANTINVNGVDIHGEWKVTEESAMFESAKLYSETGFKEEADAKTFIETLGGSVSISAVKNEVEKKKAPLLYNLAELQAECSNKLKISPDETLAVAQSLYEKKLITYPRSNARVLSTAVAVEIINNIEGLKEYEEFSSYCERIINKGWYKGIEKSHYTDDSKISDHYALIPTGESLDEVEDLSDIQKAVFDMIVTRFLSIFYPPAEYLKVSVQEKVGKEIFYANGKILNTPGYLLVAGYPDEDEDKARQVEEMRELQEGSVYESAYSLKKGETKPPKRYTSGSMVLAMENAGQLIEDEELRAQIKGSGIGTEATRAETLKKLVKLKYINLNKKTQVLTPAPLGNMIYEIVVREIPSLLSPKMTASWEKGLKDIVEGTVSAAQYRETFERYVRKECENMKTNSVKDEVIPRIKEYAKNKDFEAAASGEPVYLDTACPSCHGKVKTSKFGYICENYVKEGEGCKFGIGTIAGLKLSSQQAETLISTRKIGPLDGFKSKENKKFKASLVLKEDNTIAFDFPEVKNEGSNLDCPKCSAKLVKSQWTYNCECGFKISHTVASKKLSETEVSQLLAGQTGVITGFKSKKGKSFSAKLKLKDDYSIEFEFVNK